MAWNPNCLTFEEHGRYYLSHKPTYLFPCDSIESHRMDVFHEAVKAARGGRVHSAPLRFNEHLRILDLGTGTGIWAVEMADMYAGRSEVWGVDLAPYQPHLIPRNVKFQRLDFEASWHGIGTASWDLIHMRCLRGAVAAAAWDPLYANIYQHLVRDAGHIEHVEIDWTPRADGSGGDAARHAPALVAWANVLLECMDRAGRPLRVDPPATRTALRDAGFVDVNQEAFRLPFGARGSTTTPGSRTGGGSRAGSRAGSGSGSSGGSGGGGGGSGSGGGGGGGDTSNGDTSGDNANNTAATTTAAAAAAAATTTTTVPPLPVVREAADAEVGRWFHQAFNLWLHGLTAAPLAHYGGHSPEDMELLLDSVRREVSDPACRAYCVVYVWTARRP